MIPETWNALLRSYGFCERHAWMHIGVEMSFRDEYLLGPTILYAGLLDKSVKVMSSHSTRRLRPTGPCFLCALDVENSGAGASPPARLERGRNRTALRNFASKLEPIWSKWVCADCSGRDGNRRGRNRCRRHLITAMEMQMAVDIVAQKSMLSEVSEGVVCYQRSFSPDSPRASDRDRAALIAAIGWCCGWRPLLQQLA